MWTRIAVPAIEPILIDQPIENPQPQNTPDRYVGDLRRFTRAPQPCGGRALYFARRMTHIRQIAHRTEFITGASANLESDERTGASLEAV